MAPTAYNRILYHGQSFKSVYSVLENGSPLDLTGHSIETGLIHPKITLPDIQIDTTLTGSVGEINIQISREDIARLPEAVGYVFDLIISIGGESTVLLRGLWPVSYTHLTLPTICSV